MRLAPQFAIALAFAWLAAPPDARADCVLNGTTVTCSGNSPAGFTAGGGQNGLTVDVLTGATVGAPITLNDNNIVTNRGTLSDPGSAGPGIEAANDNNISNIGTITLGIGGVGVNITGGGGSVSNTGTITVGDGGFGIFVNGNNTTVSNSGTIRFSECGYGIQTAGTGVTITNNGSLIGTGCGNTGIDAGASSTVVNNGLIDIGETGTGIRGNAGTTITNNGRIVVGIDGTGIEAQGNATNNGTIVLGDAASSGFTFGMAGIVDNLRLVNAGTITGGENQTGLFVDGHDSTLINNGTISMGAGGVGLYINGNRGTATNNNFISIGDQGIGIAIEGNNGTATNNGIIDGSSGATTGIAVLGTGNTIRNNGTIIVGSCGVGIDTATSGNSNTTIVNNGTITASGCSAIGVEMRGGDNLTNSGTISGPISVRVAVGNTATITNTGTLDGRIMLNAGSGHTLTNSGLITVSTALTVGGAAAHEIRGTFTQTSAGILVLRVLPTATATNFDTVAVTGTANLGGRLRAQVQPGLYGSTTVYAGALTFTSSTGSFAGIDSSSMFFNASAQYNASSIDLILTRIPFTQFANNGIGGANARSVANALEAQYSTSLTGTAAAFYTQLLQSTAPNTLSQLTGEVASTGQNASFGAFGQLFSTVFGQINTSRTAGTSLAQSNGGQRRSLQLAEACSGNGSGDACQDGTTGSAGMGRRMNYWAQGFGATGDYDANATTGSAQVSVTSGGGATGIDVYVTPNFLLGAMLGTTSAGYALNSLTSTGGSQSLVFGAYGSYTAGAAYLDAALAYGRGSFTTQRYIGTGSLTEQVSGAFGGNQYGGRAEGGWTFGLNRVALTPFGNLTVQALQQEGYSETARNMTTGAPGLTGLNVQGQTTTSIRSVLGAEFRAMIELDEQTVLRPRARLGWAHEFNTYRASTATFAALGPGVPFTAQGASPASDALVITAAIEAELGGMLRIYAQFDGDFSSIARSYAGTGGVRLHW